MAAAFPMQRSVLPVAEPQPMPKPNPAMTPQQPIQGPQTQGQPAKPQQRDMPSPNKVPQITPPQAQTQQASAGSFDVQQFRPFADAVYGEATRQLDPMMQQREADFRQRMVSQGIQEGNEAYDKAFANFARERNDAYGSARNQALAQALGAQNQFFGQSATNANMANQMGLANAQMGLQGQLANASNWINQNQFGRSLNEQGRQFNANLGQRESEFGRSFGEGQRQFDQNLGFQGQRADMQDLMSLLGYGQQVTQYNNALLSQDQQRAGALFGLIPGLAPTQLDVTGPMNSYMNAQAQANAANANRSNGIFGALGQIGSAMLPAGGLSFLSDARAKTDVQKVGKLDNGLNVYSYRYTFGGPIHIGLMAQEVEQVNPLAVGEWNGWKTVNYAEAVK